MYVNDVKQLENVGPLLLKICSENKLTYVLIDPGYEVNWSNARVSCNILTKLKCFSHLLI